MYISDSLTASPVPTKCSKMTEEGRRKHGMNGNTDSLVPVCKEESSRSAYSQGGRLKFFKDGKFILELERARAGEKVSWVSVPRKTFWPPQGTAATPTYRPEGSTSLSVSDDNSSVQSSPWQRDHFWKQTTPKRNISKQLSFYYKRSKLQTYCRKRHRRQFDNNRDCCRKVLSENTIDSKDSACNNDMRLPKVTKYRPSILKIVQLLMDKIVSSSSSSISLTEAVVVSPRKRILREVEKDNKVQAEDSNQKRSRNKVHVVTTGSINRPGCAPHLNGSANEETSRTPRNSSYSITSLLAEDRSSRRSPSNSPSHFPIIQNQFCSSPPEDRWYLDRVDRLRSIELSHLDKRMYPTYSHFPYVGPCMYQYPIYYSAPGPFMRGNYVTPPMYSTPHVSMVVKPEPPSCSWTTESSTESDSKNDNIADMPLNLSKHGG